MKSIITVICSQCNKFVKTKDGKGKYGLSHGYCQECYEKIMKEMDK
jgi:hypothetical protein